MRWLIFLALIATSVDAADYLPPAGDQWVTHTPAQEGIDAGRVGEADDGQRDLFLSARGFGDRGIRALRQAKG